MSFPCDTTLRQAIIFPNYLICSFMLQNIEALPGYLRLVMHWACIVLYAPEVHVLVSFLVRVNNWISFYYAEQMHLILQLWELSHLLVLISFFFSFFFNSRPKQEELLLNPIFFFHPTFDMLRHCSKALVTEFYLKKKLKLFTKYKGVLGTC